MLASSVNEFHPARVLLPCDKYKPDYQFSLVLLNRTIHPTPLFERLWLKSDHKILADGAANWLYNDIRNAATSPNDNQPENYLPDAIVGDLDSIDESVRQYYHHLHVSIVEDKDEYSTDLAKAVRHVYKITTAPSTERDIAQDIVLFGSLGGRIDQGLGVLHELYRESRRWSAQQGALIGADDEWSKDTVATASDSPGSTGAVDWDSRRRLWLVTEAGLAMCLPPGKSRLVDLKLKTANGITVFAKEIGFIPIFGPVNLTTSGLQWDVADWRMEMGGRVSSSNHIREENVEVEVSSWCLVTFSLNKQFMQTTAAEEDVIGRGQ